MRWDEILSLFIHTHTKEHFAARIVRIRPIKKTHLTFVRLCKLETEKSKVEASISGYSMERRVFWAQAQLSSSICSEVMKDKLKHIKMKTMPSKKSVFTIFLLVILSTRTARRLWKHLLVIAVQPFKIRVFRGGQMGHRRHRWKGF